MQHDRQSRRGLLRFRRLRDQAGESSAGRHDQVPVGALQSTVAGNGWRKPVSLRVGYLKNPASRGRRTSPTVCPSSVE